MCRMKESRLLIYLKVYIQKWTFCTAFRFISIALNGPFAAPIFPWRNWRERGQLPRCSSWGGANDHKSEFYIVHWMSNSFAIYLVVVILQIAEKKHFREVVGPTSLLLPRSAALVDRPTTSLRATSISIIVSGATGRPIISSSRV